MVLEWPNFVKNILIILSQVWVYTYMLLKPSGSVIHRIELEIT